MFPETTATWLTWNSNERKCQLTTFIQMHCSHYCWTLYNPVLPWLWIFDIRRLKWTCLMSYTCENNWLLTIAFSDYLYLNKPRRAIPFQFSRLVGDSIICVSVYMLVCRCSLQKANYIFPDSPKLLYRCVCVWIHTCIHE